MPFYNTASTATALGVQQKWLDNLLSHHKIEGVQQSRQGVSRRLSTDAIAVITIVHGLVESAGIPTSSAVKLADQLVNSGSHSISIAPGVVISLNNKELEQSVLESLVHAVEVTPAPARGRPGASPSI